jgi:hypothetical protein
MMLVGLRQQFRCAAARHHALRVEEFAGDFAMKESGNERVG